MKVLIYSDIHSTELELREDEFDLVITLGDIYWQDLKKIDTHYSCKKIGVLGNHDGKDYFEGTSIENLHVKTIEFNGYKIAGLEGSPRYNQKGNSPQYYEDEMEDFVRELDKSPVDILIAHSNASDVISEDVSYAHRGFYCIKRFLLQNDVEYFLHGHEHKPREYKIGLTACECVYGMAVITIENQSNSSNYFINKGAKS